MPAFEIVTESEWERVNPKRLDHSDMHKALAYLLREPVGTKIRVACPAELYMKKYAALKQAADTRKVTLTTKWAEGWLYVKKTEKR